jgi:hypothetical protein
MTRGFKSRLDRVEPMARVGDVEFEMPDGSTRTIRQREMSEAIFEGAINLQTLRADILRNAVSLEGNFEILGLVKALAAGPVRSSELEREE